MISDGDKQKAVEWLTSGEWRRFSLVTWGSTLDTNRQALLEEFGKDHLELLKDCANCLELAQEILRRKFKPFSA